MNGSLLDYDGAVEFAREYLESRKEYFSKGPEVRIWCLQLSHRFGRINLLQPARDDAEASQALRNEAAQLLEAGEPLPHDMTCYVSEFLRNPSIPKRKAVPRNQTRDLYISMAVWQVKEKTGWAATQNRERARADSPPSACAVVADALKQMGFKRLKTPAVESIWNRYKDMEPSEN